jgi:7-keto-8-aminopelargonate synthetase-like enzyme
MLHLFNKKSGSKSEQALRDIVEQDNDVWYWDPTTNVVVPTREGIPVLSKKETKRLKKEQKKQQKQQKQQQQKEKTNERTIATSGIFQIA